jgi:hypothetical protein
LANDKLLHNYKTPLRVSRLTSRDPIKILEFENAGVVVNLDGGVTDSLTIDASTSNYFISNDGKDIFWKQPPWVDINAQSPTSTNPTDAALGILTFESGFRRISISQRRPISSDGLDGDIWFVYS